MAYIAICIEIDYGQFVNTQGLHLPKNQIKDSKSKETIITTPARNNKDELTKVLTNFNYEL